MLITKIELENITSHKKTTIDFQSGLNVLIGQNGSGKSTILNMIGYNLFDFIPVSQKSFLRYELKNKNLKKKPKFGLVKVWVVGKNDDQYIIERTLGKQSNVIEVKDVHTGTILSGINNKTSLQEWLKEQLSLKQEFDLPQLFQTSIGIPQGTYTEPFLRSPRNRKDFFDPILQVDVYREVWKKLLEIVKYYTEQIHQLDVEEGELKGILKGKEKLVEEKKTTDKEINNFQKDKARLKNKFDSVSKKFQNISDLKVAIEKSEQKCKILEIEYQNLTKVIEKLNIEIKLAEDADKKCKETEKDYLTYEKFLQREESLLKLNDILQQKKEERLKLKNQLSDVENIIESITQQIQAIDKHKKELSNLKNTYEKFEILQGEIEDQKSIMIAIRIFEEQLKEITDIYTNISMSIDEKEPKLKNQPEIVEIFNNFKLQLGGFIQRLRDKIKSKSGEESKLSKLVSNNTSLEDKIKRYYYLKEEIEVKLPELINEFDKKQELISPFIKKLEPIEQEIKKLENIPEKLKEILEGKKKAQENHDIYQSFEKTAKRLQTLKIQLSKIESELGTAKKELNDEILIKKQSESQFDEAEYNKYEKEKSELNDAIIILRGKVEAANKRIKDIDKELKDFQIKEKELEEVKKDKESLEFLKKFTETMRIWFNEAGPKITNALLSNINNLASDIYRDLMEVDNVQLIWEQDYNIKIETSTNVKNFIQLSGGEQMAAALAIRLAILKILTNADFAFFDEPTTNLDKEKRVNLAKAIQNIKGFQQLFVISHDDTFEENAEYVIKFEKDENEITHVQYLS